MLGYTAAVLFGHVIVGLRRDGDRLVDELRGVLIAQSILKRRRIARPDRKIIAIEKMLWIVASTLTVK